jgi:Secretion system C-terminal sorting domain
VLFVSGNIPSSTNIALFNSIGQCIETGSFQSSIDISRFAEGMYYLRLEFDGTTMQKAFTINHHP